MARHLVTGGAGFIGSSLASALARRGGAVRVFDDFSTGRRENLWGITGEVEVVEGDLRDLAAVRRAADGVDGIYHLGAMPSVVRSIEDPAATNAVNIGGTLNVILAARAAGVRRIVFASSSSVYGDSETLPKVETMAPAPLSPYALQKLAGEHYGRMAGPLFGVEVVSLRYFNVFGPRQDPRSEYAAVVPRFVGAALRGERPVVYGDGLQSRDFTFVENVVEATVLAMTAPRDAVGQAINIACGERHTLRDLLAEIGRITGRTLEPRHLPARPGDVRHSLASIERARALLGFEPAVGLAEGLRRTVEFFGGGGDGAGGGP